MLPARELSEFVLSSFANALSDFERVWKGGWFIPSPGHENACATRVAIDISREYNDVLDVWAEIPIKHIVKNYNNEPKIAEQVGKTFSARARVDLAVTMKADNSLLALVEFKTHAEGGSDVCRLINLHNLCRVRDVISLVSIDCRYDQKDKVSATKELRDIYTRKVAADVALLGNCRNGDWREPIDIRQPNGRCYVVVPVVTWLSRE